MSRSAAPSFSVRSCMGRTGLPRLAVWLCLLAHLLGNTALPGWIRAGWAVLDGHHDVRFAAGAAGLRIVLAHRDEPGPAPGAVHCPACLVCAVLLEATPTLDAAEPDHVLGFAVADTSARLCHRLSASLGSDPAPPALPSHPMPPPVSVVRNLPGGCVSGSGLAPPTALQVARSIVLLV
ncbi:MAG: hypothetical protein KF833_05495 [Verrucomicrobiae bacterium]|nr:hypothetical protein [Verrucomicrobiae bacterium]